MNLEWKMIDPWWPWASKRYEANGAHEYRIYPDDLVMSIDGAATLEFGLPEYLKERAEAREEAARSQQ